MRKLCSKLKLHLLWLLSQATKKKGSRITTWLQQYQIPALDSPSRRNICENSTQIVLLSTSLTLFLWLWNIRICSSQHLRPLQSQQITNSPGSFTKVYSIIGHNREIYTSGLGKGNGKYKWKRSQSHGKWEQLAPSWVNTDQDHPKVSKDHFFFNLFLKGHMFCCLFVFSNDYSLFLRFSVCLLVLEWPGWNKE